MPKVTEKSRSVDENELAIGKSPKRLVWIKGAGRSKY
jgi:hypothetical protein